MLSVFLVLTGCSEYGFGNDPANHDLSILDGMGEADGEIPVGAEGGFDLPGADGSVSTGDGPDLPGTDTEESPNDDAVGDLPGSDSTVGEGDLPDLPGSEQTEDTGVPTPPEDPGDPGDPPTPEDPEDLVDNPPSSPPPDEFATEDCNDGNVVSFTPGEIWIGSYDDHRTGEIHVAETGWYEIYNQSLAESGPSQRNESAYVLIPNSLNPSGLPQFGNCEGVQILDDVDNDGPLPAGTTRYVGTFLLEAGANEVELHHYCHLYRQGLCGQFHDDLQADKTCDSNNINSVHFFPEHVCVVQVQ